MEFERKNSIDLKERKNFSCEPGGPWEIYRSDERYTADG
jgi:hypothetical protein